ncbi:MAG: calcium/proton exchanger [Gemmatimonadaceae bacterium]
MIIKALLLFIPLSLTLRYLVHAPPAWIFVTGVVAIIPLADWIRRATEHLAHRAGSAIGGLLNVTLGNVAELIIALFVLAAGNTEVVKAQITGSLIGNSLLGLGLAALVGGWGKEVQTFKQARAGLLGSLLVLSVIALLVPALFDYTERGVLHVSDPSALDEKLSLGVSVVLILVYLANLVYTLVTHRDVFAFADEEPSATTWPLSRTLAVLLGATALIAVEAELVSGALEATAQSLGLTEFFLGVIVLAIVGNAAEYISAVYFARRDRMGLVMTITVGSTIQVALLTAPLLVIISFLMGHPMSLVFSNPLELAAIASVVLAVNAIAHDGETTWFEGLLLLAVYLVFGMAFFFVGR